jgi:hypothetical protein
MGPAGFLESADPSAGLDLHIEPGDTDLEILQLTMAGVAIGCVYALIALGFVLIHKATEVVDFAHGD